MTEIEPQEIYFSLEPADGYVDCRTGYDTIGPRPGNISNGFHTTNQS